MRIEFQVEEPSAEEALALLLPGILKGRAEFRIINYRDKQRLLRELPRRLRGYARRVPNEDLRIVVLVDADDDDCRALKAHLETMAADAGLATKSRPRPDGRFLVVNRIAVEELEAWFFGDMTAMRTAYPRISATLEHKRPYRDPDRIRGGTWEALHRELRNAGHCGASFPKIDIARNIARHMQPEANRSPSFRIFLEGIEALCAGEAV